MQIADKVNLGNCGRRTFVNFINQIDAVLIAADNLRLNHDGITAGTLVDLQNALHIFLHLGSVVNGTGGKLHFRFEQAVIHLVIAVKNPFIDNRILHNPYHQRPVRRNIENHIIKQTRGIQLFQRAVEFFLTYVLSFLMSRYDATVSGSTRSRPFTAICRT